MRLENDFRVTAPPETAWALLMDVPRIIPCMPGAELTEAVDDSTWKAKLTVKLGPMSFVFATDVKREEADPEARRATLTATARELRGRGGGQARIESSLAPLDGGTEVRLVTDLTLSGAVAQYGRGMVADVSAQLVGRFADCLKAELAGGAQEKVNPAGQAQDPQPLSGLSIVVGAIARRLAGLVRRR
jgi:carbon monoxide dehydrogenase subunit G